MKEPQNHKIKPGRKSGFFTLKGPSPYQTSYELQLHSTEVKEVFSFISTIEKLSLSRLDCRRSGFRHERFLNAYFGPEAWKLPSDYPMVVAVGLTGSGKTTLIQTVLGTKLKGFPYINYTKTTVGSFYYISDSSEVKISIRFMTINSIRRALYRAFGDLVPDTENTVPGGLIRELVSSKKRILDDFSILNLGISESIGSKVTKEYYDKDNLDLLTSEMAKMIEYRLEEIAEEHGGSCHKSGQNITAHFEFRTNDELYALYRRFFEESDTQSNHLISGLTEDCLCWLQGGHPFIFKDTTGHGHGTAKDVSHLLVEAKRADLVFVVAKASDLCMNENYMELIKGLSSMGKRDKMRLIVTHAPKSINGQSDSNKTRVMETFESMLTQHCSALRSHGTIKRICDSLQFFYLDESKDFRKRVLEDIQSIKPVDSSKWPGISLDKFGEIFVSTLEEASRNASLSVESQKGKCWSRVAAYCRYVASGERNRTYAELAPELIIKKALYLSLEKYVVDRPELNQLSPELCSRLLGFKQECFVDKIEASLKHHYENMGKWRAWLALRGEGSGNERVRLVADFVIDTPYFVHDDLWESLREIFGEEQKQKRDNYFNFSQPSRDFPTIGL